MDLIPAAAFSETERRRRKRSRARADAQALLETASASVMGSPGLEQIGSRGTPRHDKVDRAAIRLMDAEARMEEALAWEDVFELADGHFGQDSDVVMCARLLYDRGMKMTEAARVMFCDRQTVRRFRDGYVIYCAFAANGKGLLDAVEK